MYRRKKRASRLDRLNTICRTQNSLRNLGSLGADAACSKLAIDLHYRGLRYSRSPRIVLLNRHDRGFHSIPNR